MSFGGYLSAKARGSEDMKVVLHVRATRYDRPKDRFIDVLKETDVRGETKKGQLILQGWISGLPPLPDTIKRKIIKNPWGPSNAALVYEGMYKGKQVQVVVDWEAVVR